MLNIYVANLAEYVRGRLTGKWLELPMEEEDLDAALKEILGSDEELAIHDYETDLYDFKVEEYDDIRKLNEMAETIDGLEDYQRDALMAFLELAEFVKLEDVIDWVQADQIHIIPDVEDFSDLGRYWNDNIGDIPDHLKDYIDWAAYGESFTGVFSYEGFCTAGYVYAE